MNRKAFILFAAALLIALPFVFREKKTEHTADALTLVIVTPHNEAIRHEFGRAFSKWHEQRFGKPVHVDWRAIGGTTEISRYLVSEYLNASRAWWMKSGEEWPLAAGDILFDGKFSATNDTAMARLWKKFRATDDAKQFSAKVDVFFGGGSFDHLRAHSQGLTVAPWADGAAPSNLFFAADGTPLLPEQMSGETWRTPFMFGAAASTFGICCNLDRLGELGITITPSRWDDLADPRLFRAIGVSDPTKSGSIAKAFELIVHQKIAQAVAAAGITDAQIETFEPELARMKSPADALPPGVPAEYPRAIEQGWRDGLSLLQRIGANARYFTDSASKVPVDVGMGACAAGLSIDFYGRFEAESTAGDGVTSRGDGVTSRGDGVTSRRQDGLGSARLQKERMQFIVPRGGTSAAADPVSLLRGAEHRELAVRFIEFVLGEDGQKIWCYKPGTPGGPEKYALRRIPMRRDFFPSEDPAMNARHLGHLKFSADNLADPQINPYAIAETFRYHPRWTARHFNLLRDFVKAMCIDSAVELQKAWPLIHAAPEPRRTELLDELFRYPPDPLAGTQGFNGYLSARSRLTREQALLGDTEYFRAHYRALAHRAASPASR